MAHKELSTTIEWMWQSNLNPFLPTEPKEWTTYSEESSSIIEEAYRKGERFANLVNYTIDLEQRMQILNKDHGKRRPVKRVEYSKESWLQRTKTLGKGGFGTVYKGIYRNTQEVAYKVTDAQLSSDAMRETNILKTLYHPNIVRYIDVIHTARHTLLVMEVVDGGTLYEYIEKTPHSSNYWNNCQKMMIDVAYAMTYLHEKNIVHADLKSDNILLRSNGTALLSDFGLSKVIEDTTTPQSYTGAIRWLSPELCGRHPERCSFMSDVWAYGCVLLEIITKKLPWEELYETLDEIINALSDERNARIFQEFCYNQKAPDNFRRNLRACCAWSKSNRPTFTKIITDFHHTPTNDGQVQNEGSFTPSERAMSHHQRPPSAPRRPQVRFENDDHQKQLERSGKACYDPEDEKNDEFYSTSSSARLHYAGHTPGPKKPPIHAPRSHRTSEAELSD